ncbi:cytochrome P450 [[Mycobacterium] holstebronense]|uniref:Cytochrome P450 n=1 Tax=[Mycobacterium] holstebronense TaxID=3064288 RepID=A0ABN9MWH5_9MYCO|nr:cytochrome P450 [Mycolicibacter sp. MU0102]CAJ1495906.1 cytochrome P450 [Mycolicibacter sp. MU0102]
MGTLDFDFRDPELHVDPLTYQRRFAEAEPVHRNSQGLWVLTRYADVLAMLRDERVSTDRRNLYRNKLDPSRPYLTHVEHNLFYRSGDDHRRLRAPLSRAFTPRALASFEAEVATRARSLAAGLDPGGFDLVAEFAKPLPLGAIATLLGVPDSELDNLATWSMALIGALEPAASRTAFAAADDAAAGMKALLADLLVLRRADPGHDLLSVVATSGLPVSDDELLHNAIFLLSAGHDTTTAVLTGAAELLIQEKGQRGLLADSPQAVDELVRMISPALMISRVASAPIEIGESVIDTGAPILLGLAAANRDPAMFPDPDRLDLARSQTGHLGFGFGPHVCLGAPLARMQIRLGLLALFDRFPELTAQAPPHREPSAVLTSYRSYPLAGHR